MQFFEVRRKITAPTAEVWNALTDAEVLVNADTGITRIEGRLAPQEKFKLWTEVSPRTFSLRVAEFHPERRMVWQGGMPLGLFKGVRQFNLTPTTEGTDFHMREEFSGLMLPLIWKSMPDLQPSFEKFADALQSITAGGRT